MCLSSLQHQDLGSSDGPPRNWKGIGIAMVVILAVMSLVILSVIILTPGKIAGNERERTKGGGVRDELEGSKRIKGESSCDVGNGRNSLTF